MKAAPGRMFHAEQGLSFHSTIGCGEQLEFTDRVAELYERQEGRLHFVTIETKVTSGNTPLVTLRYKAVIINDESTGTARQSDRGASRKQAKSTDILIASVTLRPMTHEVLARYADASGDHNRIHVDTAYAHSVGLPDVLGHGMLSMSHLMELLTQCCARNSLRTVEVRFLAPSRLNDVITCTVRGCSRSGPAEPKYSLAAVSQDGRIIASGYAYVDPESHP
jgi:acyl dehydratase